MMLKPCPFCGEVPEIYTRGNNRTRKRSVVVKCPGCRVERTHSGLRRSIEWLWDKAADSWNQRADGREDTK